MDASLIHGAEEGEAMTLEEAVRYRIRHYSKRLEEMREMNPIPREEWAANLSRCSVLAAALAEAGLPPEKAPW
jgi:hypothetical protein